MEGHHFAFFENILCCTSINRKLHEHQYYGHVLCKHQALSKYIFNTRNYYPLMNKHNVATFCNMNFRGNSSPLHIA